MSVHHHLRRMGGRDPSELHRSATPLELLFDLTFAISFGVAASQLAHGLAAAHYFPALAGFAFASFAICWAWTNYSWFSSAYDTDDWIFRVMTMVQMVGVLVLAIGLPRMFASLENHDGHVDNSIMVLGYVIMRVALLLQWLRAAKYDAQRRGVCVTYAIGIAVVQVGWIAQALLGASLGAAHAAVVCALVLAELSVPELAERRAGGTPWHAHHIVERHTLFAIIALGEGVVGTVASLSAALQIQGWTVQTALVCISGMGLTFGMWWIYGMVPSARVLQEHRGRALVWSYCQMLIISSIVATGSGLHVAAYLLEERASTGPFVTLLTTAVPVGAFVGLIYGLYYYLVRRFDPLHTWLLSLTGLLIAVALLACFSGLSLSLCLFLLMWAPVVSVVGYEWKGHRHQVEDTTVASEIGGGPG